MTRNHSQDGSHTDRDQGKGPTRKATDAETALLFCMRCGAPFLERVDHCPRCQATQGSGTG